MNLRLKLLLGATAIVAGIVLTLRQLDTPKRARETFLGHMYHQRYAEAAAMLVAPSMAVQLPDGGLQVIAQDGTSKLVPAANLPFMAGGEQSLQADQFSATALGPSTRGVLDTPAVVLRLCLDGDRVRIVSVGT